MLTPKTLLHLLRQACVAGKGAEHVLRDEVETGVRVRCTTQSHATHIALGKPATFDQKASSARR